MSFRHRLIRQRILLFITVGVLLTSCELFYPPYLYNALNKSAETGQTETNRNIPLDGIFVSINSGDDANSGTSAASPVKTLPAAYSNAIALSKNNIYVAQGNYTTNNGLNGSSYGLCISNDGITLSGGWNSAFTLQNGKSVLNGDGYGNTILVVTSCKNVAVRGFVLSNGQSAGLVVQWVDSSIFQDLEIVGFGQSGMKIENSTNNACRDCIIAGNTSTSDGGGVFIQNGGNNAFLNCVITNNTSTSSGNGGGIAVENESSSVLSNLTVANNTAGNGGGLYINDSCSNGITANFTGNTANNLGGGAFLYQASYSTINGIFLSNSASVSGGGINLSRCTNNTISGSFGNNYSGINGGGAYLDYGQSNVLNVSVFNNLSGSGGGIGFGSCAFTTINGIISSNFSTNFGGGVVGWYNSGYIIINADVFSNTSATYGGGLSFGSDSGTITISGNVFSNYAATFGGGVYLNSDSATVSNVRYNTAGISGGGVYTNSLSSTFVTVTNNYATNFGGTENNFN